VTIQELDMLSLEGLHNLELVTGSLTVQNNAYSTPAEPDFITSLDGLRGLKYVGGGLAILQNYHLGDLGGIGPIVVPAAGSFVIQRQPQGAACCPAPVAPYVDTYNYCAVTCPLVGLGGTGGFVRVNKDCDDPDCEDNPYCEAPTPSPVAGPVGPTCVSMCMAVFNNIAFCTSCQGSGDKCFTGAACAPMTQAGCGGLTQCSN
jgi:hypothetical protein